VVVILLEKLVLVLFPFQDLGSSLNSNFKLIFLRNVTAKYVYPIEAAFEYDISSTMIRNSIKNKKSLNKDQIFEYGSVMDYMTQKNMFQ
jgi:nicotinic acid mononucleotide adenylyltransferase